MIPRSSLLRTALGLYIAATSLTGCGDETATAYGAAGHIWEIQEINGHPSPISASLTFPKPGQLSGTTACLRYRGKLTAPYPWFDPKTVFVTQTTCPASKADNAYLAELSKMEEIEVLGDLMILRNTSGGEMVFKSRE